MAGKYDLNIDQGSAFHRHFTLTDDDGTPVDVTDYTAKAELRRVEGAGPAVLVAAVGTGLTLYGVTGGIALDFTATQTGTLEETPYVWELALAPAGVADASFSLLKGQVNVSGQVATP